MDNVNFWAAIITLMAAVIGLAAVLIKVWHDKKMLNEGLKKTYDAKALDLSRTKMEQDKIQLQQQKLEFEKKKHEAREFWKKAKFGIKLLDLLFPRDEE